MKFMKNSTKKCKPEVKTASKLNNKNKEWKSSFNK